MLRAMLDKRALALLREAKSAMREAVDVGKRNGPLHPDVTAAGLKVARACYKFTAYMLGDELPKA